MNKKIKRLLILTLITVVLAVTATLMTRYASGYIHENFGNPPVIKDLLWKKLPHLRVMWVSEVFLVLSVVYLILWALIKKNIKLALYISAMCSFFHMVRAFLIVLTPLGFPYAYDGFIHAKGSIFTLGAFPSGHLSVPYLIFMLTKSRIVLGFSFLVGLTLLISRGHYSIDLVGTLLLAYPIFKFSEKYVRRYFEDERD